MQRTIITTTDGSHSIYIKELDENYHSTHGAIQESKHVFIEAGLRYIASKNSAPINILEVGLGTGLNALLTFIESKKSKLTINYTAIEAFPLELNLINQLNYIECLKEENQQYIFDLIHSSDWEKEIYLSEQFIFHKVNSKLQDTNLNDKYDLIYFDAFAPIVQPELWTEEIFFKLINVLKSDGCLVTYCAKGEVKRTLKKTGFIIESLPGPPGKREMVRGSVAKGISLIKVKNNVEY